METSNSGANHAVLHAQKDRWDLGYIETSNSGAVLHAQNDRWGVRPKETCSSGAKVAIFNAQTIGEGWDP